MRRAKRAWKLAAIAAATGVVVTLMVSTASSAEQSRATQGFTDQSRPITEIASPSAVTWEMCPPGIVEGSASGVLLECATVAVPLDYFDPGGTQIDIAISRLASPSDDRRGALITNPGGPGSGGLTMPATLVDRGVPTAVTDAYDLIGMDPRGVGGSAPVSCGFTMDSEYVGNVPPYAPDDDAVLAQAVIAERVAQDCLANDANGWMRHISTANTARDIDHIRRALGEEQISFFGVSYGSALGAAYASMFPGQTDRVVIDSNVGDTRLDQAAMRRYGPGFEEAFKDFARWAADRDGSYGLGETVAQVRKTYRQLGERLDTTPAGGFTGATFRFTTFTGMYNESSYAQTARTWQMLRSAEPAAPVSPGPTPAPWDNSWSAFLAVTCNDGGWSTDVSHYVEAVSQDRKRYPLYGAAGANITPCAFWPWDQPEAEIPIVDQEEADILVLQNQRDPATPVAGAEQIREAFEHRARLVTVDGSGHGVYVYGGNSCALNITTVFLAVGELPARDVRCRADR